MKRRKIFMKNFYRIISLIMVILMLSACDTDLSELNEANILSAKSKGEFVVAENDDNLILAVYEYDTMNPLFTHSSSVREAMRLIYEPLFDINPDYSAEPVLAESYSLSEDGKKVTVQLRKNIMFHDGVTFNANDVVYTFESVKAYQGRYLEYMKDVRSCEKNGEYSVVFTLSRPIPNFVSLLTFPIVKNHSSLTADKTFTPIGTGAYKYKGKGDIHEIRLGVSESWRGTEPNIKEVSLLVMTDKQRAIYAFGASEIDCISGRAVDLNKYNLKGSNNIYNYSSNDLTFLGINFYNPIFWGKGTRQALSCLVNKDNIIRNVIYQRGTKTDVPINPLSWQYGEHIENYTYDSARAEILLADDGWTKNDSGVYSRIFNGAEQNLKMNILVNGENEEKVNIANEIAQNLTDVGIPTGVSAVSYNDYAAKLTSKQYDIAVCEVNMPNNMDLYSLLSSEGNYFTYSSAEMDGLISKAGRSADKAQVTECYAEISRLFIEDAPFVPLFFRHGTLICGKKVTGNILPGPEYLFKNVDEWFIYNE